MGTEVLRPQDCLIERIRVASAVFPRRKSCYGNGNPRFRKPAIRPDVVRQDQKKRFNIPSEPSISKRSTSFDGGINNNSNNLVMEQVTILRRGDPLVARVKVDHQPLRNNDDDDDVFGVERLGPEPEKVSKQIVRVGGLKSDTYAGSGFFLSPAPSDLPLPSFFNKKQVSAIVFVDDSATKDLRRLLRLD